MPIHLNWPRFSEDIGLLLSPVDVRACLYVSVRVYRLCEHSLNYCIHR